MVTSMSEQIEGLVTPISSAQPQGHFDEEDELYLAIDMEMVKLGGLQAQTLDWVMVEQASTRYLRERCKHFRIMGHLVSAWLRDREWEGWIKATWLTAAMVEAYWLSGYPRRTPNSLVARQRQFTAGGDRLLHALKQLHAGGHSDEVHARASAAVDALARAEQKHAIEPSVAARLLPALRLAAEAAKRSAYEPAHPERALPPSRGGDTVNAAFFTTRSDSPLGNERETRTLYLKLAEFINQQDAYEPTGYLLRRHALWSGILSTPPVKREQRTELMCVPIDIATEYQEAVAGSAISPALLLRIEKSLASSPYWLRGSFLAATVAQRLEMPMVAMVIKSAAERFVRRLPTLRELRFSDGTRFIDDDVFAWLSAAGHGQGTLAGPGPLAARRGALDDAQAADEAMDAFLLRLQSRQDAGTPPRERHYASVAAADALATRGLGWLAQDIYAGVARAMAEQTASQWEPGLFDHVVARSGQRTQ